MYIRLDKVTNIRLIQTPQGSADTIRFRLENGKELDYNADGHVTQDSIERLFYGNLTEITDSGQRWVSTRVFDELARGYERGAVSPIIMPKLK